MRQKKLVQENPKIAFLFTKIIFTDLLKKIDKSVNLIYNDLVIELSKSLIFPGVAQLVARQFWELDAAGSNPVTRTKNPRSSERGFFIQADRLGISPTPFGRCISSRLWRVFLSA